MARVKWDQTGERLYETGVDRGVLYPFENGTYPKGYAWNGLTAVTESPSGAEPTPLYANNNKYLNLLSREDYAATIEAYMYPDEFAECNGYKEIAPGVVVKQQKRKQFGLSYRTLIGNDTEFEEHGYKIHLVYGCLAAPAEQAHNSVNESPDVSTMSWEISTTPVEVPNMKPTASIDIDSTKVAAEELAKFEDIIYGKDGVSGEEGVARLPLPAELATIFTKQAAG